MSDFPIPDTSAVPADSSIKKQQYIVNRMKIGKKPAPIIRQSKLDRKINLKLVSSDVQILDLIAEHYKVPRSVIVNEFLNEILTEDFKKIPDMDTKFMIAHTADKDVYYSDMNNTWLSEAQPAEAVVTPLFKKTGMEVGTELIPYSDSFKIIFQKLQAAGRIKPYNRPQTENSASGTDNREE